ncbi:hypothetical protein F5878DRAFT_667319 [Lentinula raphanica]|uniref:Uncharacterized protein n=1 Tax=Lentinula raphanica TaxID=153919 RepID=A0AA38NW36_9AGAR|nr:hypothetical protein F5878DRAFT_667319 [Lentinula raphanica]
MELLTTSRDVRKIMKCINRMLEDGRYSSSLLGMFMGTGCDAVALVPVPVEPRLRSWESIDQLDIRMYLWTSNEPAVKTCSRNRYHIDRFPPDATTALTNPFTFYFEDIHTPTPTNQLMRRKSRSYDNNIIPAFHGNLLVIKHDRKGVVDMETSDWPLVKVILDWLVINRGEYDDVIPPMFFPPKLLEPPLTGERSQSQSNRPAPPSPHDIAHIVWQHFDLRWNLFEHTGVLSLFALSCTCTTMRLWVQAFYRSRIKGMLSKAFPKKQHANFLDLLEEFDGRIGGSAAYCVVDPCAPLVFNNIDILVPFGSGANMCRSLVGHYGLTDVSEEREPIVRDRFESWVHDVYEMQNKSGFTVKVTESQTASLVPLMVAGYTTAECVLIGRSNFTLLYPSLVENGDVLYLHSMVNTVPPDQVAKLQRRWHLLDSTQHLGLPCQESCPRLWRRSVGYRNCALLDWGGYRSGGETDINWGSFEWKVGFDCHNPLCNNPRPFEMCRWLCWDEQE